MIKTVSQLKRNDKVLLISTNKDFNKKICFVEKVGRKYISVKEFVEQKYNFLMFDIKTLQIKEDSFPTSCELFIGSLEDYNKRLNDKIQRKELRYKIYNICFELPLDKLQEILNFANQKSKEL